MFEVAAKLLGDARPRIGPAIQAEPVSIVPTETRGIKPYIINRYTVCPKLIWN